MGALQRHLTTLVEQVSGLVDKLEKLFPELLEVEKKLAQKEAEGADEEIVQALPKLAVKIDPLLAEALTAQMSIQAKS